MSKIALSPNASGTGVFTIASPSGNTDRTLTLPDEAGTVLTTAGVPASAMPAGSVLQVVHASTTTIVNTTSTTLVDTGFQATITPTSASSKILILFDIQLIHPSGGMGFGIYRDASLIYEDATNYAVYVTQNATRQRIPFTYLDSPSTTSSISYKLYMKSYTSSSGICNDNNATKVTLMEIAG